jgi:hypothetical protein
MTEKKPVFYYGAEASVLGVVKAVLYNQVRYFTTACPDPKHFFENSHWVRFSIESLSSFTGIPLKTIYDNLRGLEKDGYIKTGNFNKLKYDRTKWYSLTDKPLEPKIKQADIPLPNSTLPFNNLRNELDEIVSSQLTISEHNTYNNLNNNLDNNKNIINKNNNTNSGDFLTHQPLEEKFFDEYFKRKGLL